MSDSESENCMICNEDVPLNCDRDYACLCEGVYCSLCFYRKCIILDDTCEVWCCYNCLPSELEDKRDEYLRKSNGPKKDKYKAKIAEINEILNTLKYSEEPEELKTLIKKDDLMHL